MINNYLEFLRCPNSGERLSLKEDELHSSYHVYPIIEEIPWLFENPEQEFISWSGKITNYIKQEEERITSIKSVSSIEPNKDTKQRLEKIYEGLDFNLSVLKNKLSIFQLEDLPIVDNSSQQIISYFKLLFRDWSWGDKEINIYKEFILKNESFKNKKILILGAGACGLSYELAKACPSSNFFSLEHNPLLSIYSKTILESKALDLYEVNLFPKNFKNSSVKRSLKASEELSNHHLVLSSFPNIPFEKDSFDVIISPWFLDILNMSFSLALEKATKFLKSDGNFLFIGPSNIHSPYFTNQYTSSEIVNEFNDYFINTKSQVEQVDYLNSPIDTQKRVEDILFIHASKLKLRKTVKKSEVQKEEILNYNDKLITYKATTETFYRILKHINKTTNKDELSTILINEFGFNKQESLHYAGIFITKINNELSRV